MTMDNPYSLIQDLDCHEDLINSLSFSPSGDLLASACDDSMIAIWYIESGTPIQHMKLPMLVMSIAWDPQANTRIIFGCEDGVITLLDNIHVSC